jgi:hypothetical protein
LFTVTASAQTPLPPAEYGARKAAGTLPADASEAVHPIGNVHWTPPAAARDSGACDCLIAPDASYLMAMAPNDDGSSVEITLPFTFDLFGVPYTSLFINNNGNVSFGGSRAASRILTSSWWHRSGPM